MESLGRSIVKSVEDFAVDPDHVQESMALLGLASGGDEEQGGSRQGRQLRLSSGNSNRRRKLAMLKRRKALAAAAGSNALASSSSAVGGTMAVSGSQREKTRAKKRVQENVFYLKKLEKLGRTGP